MLHETQILKQTNGLEKQKRKFLMDCEDIRLPDPEKYVRAVCLTVV
jgi:hypothetical protein